MRLVTVLFFKPSGKWYTTNQIPWIELYDGSAHANFRYSLLAAGPLAYPGQYALCVESPAGFPLMLLPDWDKS
jgi:hypothetical protein